MLPNGKLFHSATRPETHYPINHARTIMSNFPAQQLREQFPALHRTINDRTPIFLDGPAGTQVPQRVIDAITHYLTTCNANHAGVFTTSRESDAIIHNAHEATADFLNAPSADEIIFGQNMTTLTFHLSRSLACTWNAGDEILVTRLDHDANVRPWTLAARDSGAIIHYVDFHPEDGTLNLEDLRDKLNEKTVLVAIGAASNLLGTINDVRQIAKWAHEVNAKVFVDAVHYAPHGPMDVQAWDCDFLACSAYKFFGPHVGILWGKQQWLEELEPYKVRPSENTIPDRWMTGTQNHEGLAGVAAAIEYLADITQTEGTRREKLRHSMKAIRDYEIDLARKLLNGLAVRSRFKVWGITNPEQINCRAPTISIALEDRPASDIAWHLAEREIYTWAGHSYALEVTERLDLEKRGGVCRLGLVHYNTPEEVDSLLGALDELA